MKEEILQILKRYWGYNSFRESQEDIIFSILKGQDTLALLPTGGGKSICFQVPILKLDGIGIVVSPLIALMNDQVRQLKNRGISAVSISSAMTNKEIDLILENSVNGKYKFLYLSPERLKNDMVQARMKRMNINLLAIDEAHCISQWGYDFRPSYLQISEIRKLLPEIPILALTATATPMVVEDIQDKLEFKKPRVFQKSFFRENLHYNILKTEQKWTQTLEILKRIKGTGIIYSRNRKNTVEIAQWLQKCGVSADFYHAGLSNLDRERKQEEWIENKTRIMVSTNAFGMGIDKADVRLVIHLELPDSLESYFQEAGRGGRDEKTAYSIVIVDPSDIERLENRYLNNFPDLAFIRRVYQALGNYLQLALGSGENQSFDFEIEDFTKQYGLPILKTFQSLKILERESYLSLNEGFNQSSKIWFKADRASIYDYQLRNSSMDGLIKLLFRSYGGLELEFTSINEWLIAKRLKSSKAKVILALSQLKNQGLIDYIPAKEKPQIIILKPRSKSDFLNISDENLKDRFESLKDRIHSVVNFVAEEELCRSRILLKYFGEEKSNDCGHCDICRKKNQKTWDTSKISKEILNKVSEGEIEISELFKQVSYPQQIVIEEIRKLIDQELIRESDGQLKLMV